MKFDKNPSVGGDGEFLKLENGKSVTGVFRGDPLEYYSKWEGKKSIPCAEGDEGARFRFRVNFVTKVDGAYKALIWEQGATVYNQLKRFNEDFPLDKTVVKISRSGSTMNDTVYFITPNPGGHEVNPATEDVLKNVQLQELGTGMEKPQAQPGMLPPPAVNHAEELPF